MVSSLAWRSAVEIFCLLVPSTFCMMDVVSSEGGPSLSGSMGCCPSRFRWEPVFPKVPFLFHSPFSLILNGTFSQIFDLLHYFADDDALQHRSLAECPQCTTYVRPGTSLLRGLSAICSNVSTTFLLSLLPKYLPYSPKWILTQFPFVPLSHFHSFFVGLGLRQHFLFRKTPYLKDTLIWLR